MIGLNKVRIGVRLTISFSVILALLAAIAGFSLWRLDELATSSKHLVSVDANGLSLATEFDEHAQAASVYLLQILITDVREERIPLYRAMDSESAAADARLVQLRAALGAAQAPLLKKLKETRDVYGDALRESVELIELDGGPSARKHFSKTTKPALDEVLRTTSLLTEQLRRVMQQEQLRIEQNNHNARVLVIGLSVVALVLGALLAYLVSRSIVEPIRTVVAVARRIAQGDLRSPEVRPGRDEISQLMTAFVTMCDGLQGLVEAIRLSSEEVERAVHSIESPVTNVAAGSDKQREAVGRILTAVAAFSNQAANVSTTANESTRQAMTARDLAIQGQKMVHEASVEIDRIAVTITDSADAVERLGSEAQSVRSLVVTVKEIADQTNLLALNAAIEAARAGESGRGFSVVADEVRKLAERSANATKQINQVIDTIDRETASAVDCMAKGRTEMLAGAELIRQMIAPLGALSDGAQTSLDKLETLSLAADSQVHESDLVEVAVQQIAVMARDNHDSVGAVTGTSARLNEISRQLGAQVRGFVLASAEH